MFVVFGPAEVSELGEGQGQHLYLYVAPEQIGGSLERRYAFEPMR